MKCTSARCGEGAALSSLKRKHTFGQPVMTIRKSAANAALQRCELTQNPAKRAAANALTDSIKHDLPAGLSRPALRALASVGIAFRK